MKSTMGTSSSKRAKPRKPQVSPSNPKPSLKQSELLDIELLPQFEMQQSQSISTYQALPPLVLSRQQLSRRDAVQKEATKAKVLTENPKLTDLLEEVKSLTSQLSINIDGDMKANTMSDSTLKCYKGLLALFNRDIPAEQKKLVGDEIAANKGGQLINKSLTALSSNTKADSSHKGSSRLLILSVCCKSSETSQEFCTDLGKSGVFQILVGYINETVNKQEFGDIAKVSVAILRNCVRMSENKVFLKEAGVVEAMAPYLKSTNREVKMIATLIVAHIINEEDSHIVSGNDLMIKLLCQYLEGAMKTPSHEKEGFKVEEVVSALMNLASDDNHKETIVNNGTTPFLVELLKRGNTAEKTIAAKTVWVLSFSKTNQKKMLGNKDLVKSLKVLSKMEGAWRQAATGAIWVLEEEKRIERMKQQSQPPATRNRTSQLGKWFKAKAEKEEGADEQNTGKADSDKHVMISYQWSCQKLMIKVKEQLEHTGYRVWIDIESMGGSTLQAMAEAVENASVVLLCMSRKYKDSPNCRTEAEYAYKLGKPLIPIRIEQDYEPDGWLGALQGAKLYYDFSNIVEFDAVFIKLAKEISTRGKMKPDVTDQPSFSTAMTTVVESPLESQNVNNWTASDVADWATKNKLAIKNISTMDGETLLFLRGLRVEAPEFYYRFAFDRLSVTDLRGLHDLNKALAKLGK